MVSEGEHTPSAVSLRSLVSDTSCTKPFVLELTKQGSE